MTWDEPQTINALRVVSGYRQADGTVDSPVSEFAFQYREGTGWREIPGTAVRENSQVDWSTRVQAITARQIRVEIRKTPNDVARIWEIEAYNVR